jgi:uncharacterized protein (DUF58 family)
VKGHTAVFLGMTGCCLLAALSTGGQLYWLLFLVLALMAALAWASALWAWATLRVSHALGIDRVARDQDISLRFTLGHRGLLPVAPVLVSFWVPDADKILFLRVLVRPGRPVQTDAPFYCPHVGVFPVGVVCCEVRDVFGLFTLRRQTGLNALSVTVVPGTFQVRPLQFAPGDSGNDAMARATDDASSPADVRAYQEGDELKRVHWKLSMRKREIMVRRFEEPARPDALILMDCAPPAQDPEDAYTLRDALCETAASVAAAQLAQGNPVRMPLLSAQACDVACDSAAELPFVLDALAQVPFDGTDRFERVLLLETRRLRRTGGTVVITSRMDATIADMLLRIRRMGPRTRLYLAHRQPIDQQIETLLVSLEKHDIEVETLSLVVPEPALY